MQNLIVTLNIMSITVFKNANKEQLGMICLLKYNLLNFKSKNAGHCSKCTLSLWFKKKGSSGSRILLSKFFPGGDCFSFTTLQ